MKKNRPCLWTVLFVSAALWSAAADSACAQPEADLSGQPLELSLAEAVVMALENNRSLAVQRLDPAIVQTFEDEARAEFDPRLDLEASARHTQGERTSGADTIRSEVNDTYEGVIALSTYFPTGTTLTVEAATERARSSAREQELAATRLGATVTQSMLRGFGPKVNLARLRQARLDTAISRYELHGFSESLVAQVENAYWDYALSLRQVDIVEESLKLAQRQLEETRSMIEIGTVAESELVAVQAEVALQQQSLINARSTLAADRLRLLLLLNPPGQDPWRRDIVLLHPPQVPRVVLDSVETHVAVGLRKRPEVNQAELEIRREELEIVHTRNGLLPRLDLFVSLGKSGYADAFGKTIEDLPGDSNDVEAGVILEYPIGNRSARARHSRALFSREQAQKALRNLIHLVELDIRTAYLEVNRSREQIAASAATRALQEEKLRIETEKFRVGQSTNLLVAQAQRDLLASRIDEVQAVVAYLSSLTELYRLEGTLLERRGVTLYPETSIPSN